MKRLRVVKATRQDQADARWFAKRGPDPENGTQVASDEKIAAALRRHDAVTARRRSNGQFRKRGMLARLSGRR